MFRNQRSRSSGLRLVGALCDLLVFRRRYGLQAEEEYWCCCRGHFRSSGKTWWRKCKCFLLVVVRSSSVMKQRPLLLCSIRRLLISSIWCQRTNPMCSTSVRMRMLFLGWTTSCPCAIYHKSLQCCVISEVILIIAMLVKDDHSVWGSLNGEEALVHHWEARESCGRVIISTKSSRNL